MATQLLKTNRRTYDHNPQGSATATVVTAGDNPFERTVSLKTNSMLPSMGMAGLGEDPAPAQEPSEWIKALQTGLTTIGLTALSQEVIKAPKSTTLQAQGAQQLPAAQPISLNAPGSTAVPPANTIGYPIRQSMTPAGGGIMGKLPWIIGGVAVLGIGGLLLFKKK
jgi:hypothetical protein